MPNQVTIMRGCGHADVGDCEVACFGMRQHVVTCSDCGNVFDLNHSGNYEHNAANCTINVFACSDCPLPSESAALPRLNPSLAAVIALDETMSIHCLCGTVVKGKTSSALSKAYKTHRAVFHALPKV